MFLFLIILASFYFLSKSIFKNAKLNAFLHVFVGTIIFGFLYIIKEKIGLKYDLFYSSVFLFIGVLTYIRRHNYFNNRKNVNFREISLTLILSAPIWLPIFMQSFYTYGENYSKYFFNVDSAYYMQFIHQFIENEYYPPKIINNNLNGINYHFGSIAITPMISEFTGQSPHNLFYIFIPIFGILIYINLLQSVAKKITNGTNSQWLIFVFIAYGNVYYNAISTNSAFLWSVKKNFMFTMGHYYSSFPQIPSLFGTNLFLIIVLSVLNWEQKSFKILGSVMLAVLPLFKLPYIPIASTGFLIFVLIKENLNKKLILSIVLIITIMMSIYLIFVRQEQQNYYLHDDGIAIKWRGNYTRYDFLSVIVFSIFTFISFVWGYLRNIKILNELHVFVFPFLIISLMVEIKDINAYQLNSLAPLAFCLSTAKVFVLLFRDNNKYFKLGLAITIFCFSSPGIYNGFVFTKLIYQNPLNGHEVVSNANIVNALSSIPVKNTIIITNDIRYPAENFRRKNSQFQLSAIFGHTFLNSELNYSRSYDTNHYVRQRMTFLLQDTTWNDSVLLIAAKLGGATHILIHKLFPYPKNIPFEQTFSDGNYSVFQIRN